MTDDTKRNIEQLKPSDTGFSGEHTNNEFVLRKVLGFSTPKYSVKKAGKKVGRPRSNNKRTYSCRVVLTKDEYEELTYIAEGLKVSKSEVLRSFLSVEMPKSPEQTQAKLIAREQFLELAKIGNNINQIARVLNYSRKIGHKPELNKLQVDQLRKLFSVIQLIRKELFGGTK